MISDENLAVIHSYLCADGYVIKNSEQSKHKHYHIGFRNTNLILLEDFQNRFFAYFKIKPHLIPGQKCRIGSKEIYEQLTKEFGSFYSRTWTFPKIDPALRAIWLRAYFDCDGWVTNRHHKTRSIGAECVNLTALLKVKNALESLGIKTSEVKKKGDRNIYSLMIYGKENLEKFSDKVGFLHPLKNNKLKEAIANFVNYEWNFPKNKDELNIYLFELMKRKAKIRKSNGIVRVNSKLEKNLNKLQECLINIFDVESKVSKRTNGLGTIYYELSVNKKEHVNKLINADLVNSREKTI